MTSKRVVAPAKVNLFLAVGRKRDDGYHDLTSVYHALSLHDVLTMSLVPNTQGAEDLSVSVTTNWKEGIAPTDIANEDNLIVKAILLLGEKAGHTKGHIDVVVDKHIPMQAGLGGGSSDAAAALVGAAELWGVDAHDPAIEEAAAELGADVAFFLKGGCAIYTGKGEEFVRSIEPIKNPVAIIKPFAGNSTAEVYAKFDEKPGGYVTDLSIVAAQKARNLAEVPVRNNLTAPARELCPEITEITNWLEDAVELGDVVNWVLCGSGSAVLAIAPSVNDANALVVEAQKRGYWARSTTFSPLAASIVPEKN